MTTRRIFARLTWATFALLFAILPAACRKAEPAAPAPPPDSLAALDQLADGWNTLAPEDGTQCSDGSPYSFFVRKADPAKLLVYFQGGGACWFGDNCDLGRQPSYKPTVGDTDPAKMKGIFELENPENPFSAYSMVFVPYCTGDVHLGEQVTSYEVAATDAVDAKGKPVEHPEAHTVSIQHKGHVNAERVLAWTYRNFAKPATVFVTGSSAGAIPSPLYAMEIADRYPEARVVQLGDAAGGYRGVSETKPQEQWGTMAVLSPLPEFHDMPADQFTFESLYVTAGKRHPNVTFAEYDAAEDETQLAFLALSNRKTDSLQPLLDANQADIHAAIPNFRSFVAGGKVHTILGRPELYSYRVGDTRVRDWVAALAAGDVVADVHCQLCSEPEQTEQAAPEATGGGG